MHGKRKYEPPMLVDIHAFHAASARCDATGSAADPADPSLCEQGTSATSGGGNFGQCTDGSSAAGSTFGLCQAGTSAQSGSFGGGCSTGLSAT